MLFSTIFISPGLILCSERSRSESQLHSRDVQYVIFLCNAQRERESKSQGQRSYFRSGCVFEGRVDRYHDVGDGLVAVHVRSKEGKSK